MVLDAVNKVLLIKEQATARLSAKVGDSCAGVLVKLEADTK